MIRQQMSVAQPPDTLVQRTRSSASALRWPLMRCPLSRLGSMTCGLVGALVVAAMVLGAGWAWAVPAPEAPAEPFVLDSTQSTYPFVFRVEGTLKRQGDAIEVSVKSGEIRSTIPPDLGEDGQATNVLMSFGVGRLFEGGWQMVNHSQPDTVSTELRPGESLPVTPHRFVIKGLAGMPLAEMWLAASLTVTQKLPGMPAGPLSSYGCSTVNLLGGTPASRERAKKMAGNYAHVC
jgi:hypothetical protein